MSNNDSKITNNIRIDQNTITCSDPTPSSKLQNNSTAKIFPSMFEHTTGKRYSQAANSLLHTVDINMTNIREWAILDSGATSHFLVTAAPTSGIMPATNPLKVTIPDGSQVQSTHTCKLAIPNLPDSARIGHIIPGLASHSLLSVVKLCNAGCEVSFTKIACIVKHNGKIVLQGHKCDKTGLWMVPLDTRDSVGQMQIQPSEEVLEHMQFSNFAYEYLGNIIPTSSKEELAMYYHQCLCSPPKTTMLRAIRNGQLQSFPGLTYELIARHLPPSTATDKGHMIRTRSGV